MNRFFSKLDLRDIKIKPEGSNFPPDDDDGDIAVAEEHVDPSNEPVFETEYHDVATLPDASEPVEEDVPIAAPVSSNGHLAPEDVQHPVKREQTDEILKVSARSRPSAVAGAIAGVVREFGRAEVQAIGAGATNQAVKATAIARDYLLETEIDVVCVPAFIDVTIDGEERTAIRLVIGPR
jgi:stage V sporulation protein S